MSHENPGAYNEARNRLREKREQEEKRQEESVEKFVISQEKIRKRSSLDVSSLRQKISIGKSLEGLKGEVSKALKEGLISRDTYDRVIASIEAGDRDQENQKNIRIDPNILPFSQNQLAKWLEDQPLGNNIISDIIGFMYGFFIQGSALLVIIAWKILTDLLFLPRDAVRQFQKR